jgi:multimeric flavodoxin WrbA
LKTVLAINSSRRRKNTYGLILSAGELLTGNDIALKVLNLYDLDIRDCNGCENCIRNGECPIKDDAAEVMSELKAADGLILTSPVYMAGVSGKLKTFIDRTCAWYHRPQLAGKPVLLMTTTAGGYAREVLGYMEKVSVFWGMRPSGKIYRTAGNIDKGVTPKETAGFIKALNTDKRRCRPGLKTLLAFQVQKVLALKVLPADKAFWEQQKWHEQIYYYKCRIPLYKRLIAGALYKILDMVIKPAPGKGAGDKAGT